MEGTVKKPGFLCRFFARGANNIAAQLLLISLVGNGCVVKRETVRSLSLGAPPAESGGPRLAVEMFRDRRGEDAIKYSVTRYLPVVNFVHIADTHLLPEQTAAISRQAEGIASVLTGSLERDLPYHLARLLPADYARGTSSSADFQIFGTIDESALKAHLNIVPGWLLSAVGIPYLYTSIDLRWSITVVRCGDRENPVIEKSYDYSDRAVTGLYYGAMAARELFVAALTKTLAEASADIRALVAAAGPCSSPAKDLPPVESSKSGKPPKPGKSRR